jgi:hypothetical protein
VRRHRTGLIAGLFVFAATWLPAAGARAANSPTFRDCSLVAGLDPDFVQLSGATVGSNGSLSVTSGQSSVTVEASESADPGDNQGHDTFSVTVSGPGATPRTVSGQGTGHVTLSVPLAGVAPGGQYTLTWAATFDDNEHPCPGGLTPMNPAAGSNPFVLNVIAGPPPPALTLTGLRESHHKFKEGPARGTTFGFDLSAPARVKLAFQQIVRGRSVGRGSHSLQGTAGHNSVRFRGRIPGGRRLKPGRYELVVTAVSADGQRAPARRIAFTISR